jgi:hypothetical protein
MYEALIWKKILEMVERSRLYRADQVVVVGDRDYG